MGLFRRHTGTDQPVTPPSKRVIGLTVLAFADIHRNRFSLPEDQPDLVLLLGDIPFQVVNDIDGLYRCPKLGVLGNYDGSDYLDGTNVVNLHSSIVNIKGITFAGFAGAPRYNSRPHGQYTEEEVRTFIDGLNRVDVFVAHSNPWDGLTDPSDDPAHAGFKCFSEYIRRVGPTHFFHGHIHEKTEYEIGGTKLHAVYEMAKCEI